VSADFVRWAVAVCVLAACAGAVPQESARPHLRWGGDAEGGAPYVEADAQDPARVVGFDVEIAELVAARTGRTAEFVQIAYTSLDESARRGDFELGLSGIEDIPARRAALAASLPYYAFREVLTVRAADAGRFRTLADLRGHAVATLGGTLAYDVLLEAERTHGLTAVSYDDDVHPYSDLELGRVDAVLLDNVLADRALRRHAGLVTQPESVALGHYIAISAPSNVAFMREVDGILRDAMRDGTLERIFRKWKVWNEDQRALFAEQLSAGAGGEAGPPAPPSAPALPRPHDVSAGAAASVASSGSAAPDAGAALARYLPSLLRAAAITLALSCAAMALAIALGACLAIARVYGGPVLRVLCTVYVEVLRGTPVLLQLFVIYYGLASVVRLPAYLAAAIGLGLNYAAYESEIYRSALEAVPRGQLEAARVLGFTRAQTLRLVRGPQAFRLALAPMTNDFVAMLKDSSLVSVLTVVELTKQTQIFATNVGSWVVPGIVCAALYLAMSLPLGQLARRLEARWKLATP
jgi:polar amino acid transport system substrate-binding protein